MMDYPSGSLSAATSMVKDGPHPAVIVGCTLLGVRSTASLAAEPGLVYAMPSCQQQTNAGCGPFEGVSPGAAIAELRRVSGLTWDQLARLVGVSRRTLHFWASGTAVMAWSLRTSRTSTARTAKCAPATWKVR